MHGNDDILATTTGILATTNGTGSALVDGAGKVNVNAIAAGTTGISATQTNNVAGTVGNVTVSGSGNVGDNVTPPATGINAQITGANNAGAILVNRTGTVTAGTTGINATSAGSGNVTVTGVGTVIGSSGTGIIASRRGRATCGDAGQHRVRRDRHQCQQCTTAGGTR